MERQDPATHEADLRGRLQRHVLRRGTRNEDWEAFAYETHPQARRAQMRYVGAGGSGQHHDPNTVPAEHFTVSVLNLPPGCVGSAHAHEIEEVFFVLQGQATCFWWEDGVEVSETMGPWDMVWNPPGVMHGFRNDTDEPVYLQVLLGSPRPALPTYAETDNEQGARDRARALGTR